MNETTTSETAILKRYVPRVSAEWDLDVPGELSRAIVGTLVFVDISGFTNLSERLSRKGRIGAEELTAVLNRVFGEMLDIAVARGGSLLKFGGDALLLFFDSIDHVLQATAATVEMRAALRNASKEQTSVGRIHLKMSSGIHTGSVDFFLVGDSHRELLIAGPVASRTTEMEGSADAGQIVVSSEVKKLLPKDFTGEAKGDGWLLRKQKVSHPLCGPVSRRHVDDDTYAARVPFGLLGQLAIGPTDSEHRIATVGFVKFKGVDGLLETAGPELVAKELNRLVTAVQVGADREGVTFLGSDIDAEGGKIILTAGVPDSRHDDEGRMLRTARTLLDAEYALSVQVGVNRGHVFSGDVGTEHRGTYTVMGDTVNLAARLMAAAGPGMLYATPDVLDRSTTLFDTEALEPFYVKGKDDPVRAYEVFEDKGVRPPETKHELPFGGRDAELDLIVGIVTTCVASGSGGMMTITGDIGLGKSRLMAEALDQCPGLDTLMLQAEPNGTDVPYWAFRDPMRRMLEIEWGSQEEMARALRSTVKDIAPDLEWALPLVGDAIHIEVPDTEETAALDPQFRPDRTADAVIELLKATYSGPFALLAEDGHWMDPASIALVRRVGEAAVKSPWTVIFTARREDQGFEPLGTEIPLSSLGDEAIRSIAIEATEAAPLRPHELDAVVNRAGGNPLFLSEILQMIRVTGNADSLPESLGAVVSSEIDTLPPLTRQVLRYASVIGRSFSRVILDELLEPEDLRLDEATREELDRFIDTDDSHRMRFRHAVVHDAAYEGLSFRRRRELHGRAGKIIETLAGDNPESAAESLATHYSLSGEYENAWHYSQVAADKARRAYANTEAAAHYRKAIDAAGHLKDIDSNLLANTWTSLGEVQELAGQMDAARASFGQAVPLLASDAEALAAVCLRRAGTWMATGNFSQAKRNITLGRKYLDNSESNGSLGLRARLDAFEASVHAANNRPVEARQSAHRAIEQARATDELEALARSYVVMDWANFMTGGDEPRRGEEVVRIYEELGLTERSVVALNNLGAYAYFEGDWGQTMRLYERGVEAAERSGNIVEAAHIRTAIAELLISQRKFQDALPLLEDADRVMRSSHAAPSLPFVGLQRARAQIGLGEVEPAVAELKELATDQLAGNETEWTGDTAVTLAGALAQTDRADEALAWVEKLEAEASDSFDWVMPGALRVRATAYAAQGHMADAMKLLQEALEAAIEKGDFLEQILIREERVDLSDRVAKPPDPTDLEELEALTEKLDILF